MLPFDNSSGKKFVCFCCGLNFSEYSEYSSHIIEKHEEGRDYILCPLLICRCPIRDLKMHWEVKHKNIPLPKINGMMQALIWRDFSSKGEKKTKKPRFRSGFYESTKMHKSLKFRSGWEETVYEILDSDVNISTWNVEPFRIKYIFQGKLKEYIPDLIVKTISNQTFLYEIKPSAQTLLPVNVAKFQAAEKACQDRGWIFEVLTEQSIEKWKKKVKLQQLNE